MKINSELLLILSNISGYFALTVILVKISIEDIKHKIIEDRMNLLVCIIGISLICVNCVLKNWTGSFSTESAFINIKSIFSEIAVKCLTASIIPIFIICLNFFVKNAFGGGDIKLIFALGTIFEFEELLGIMAIGTVLAGVFGGFVWCCKIKRTSVDKGLYIPFAPFISIGTIITFIAG